MTEIDERPWPESVTINDAMALRRMGRDVGAAWLIKNRPLLTPEETERVLSVLPETPKATITPYQHQGYDVWARYFCTAAWLCGASIRQLARSYGVKPPTISAKINAIMPSAQRRAARLSWKPITEEQVGAMRVWFYTNANQEPDTLIGANLVTIAEQMLIQIQDEV